MPTPDAQGISLTSVRNPVAGFVELNKKKYNVLKFTGDQYKRVEAATDATPVTRLYELAAEVCPTMPAKVLDKCNRDEIGIILLVAGRGIAAVKALFPNVESPETPTSPG
jgi:hypothetical protein